MLHDDIETPLVRVLAKMEVAGIGVDRAELQAIADSLKESAATLQAEVQELAGHEFNVNSTPQLRTVLYDELGLTPGKKTKTGLLDRRPDAREPARRPPDHRRAARRTARWRSCARPTARACWPRWRPTGASTPRSGRRWPARVASPRTAPTCTTSRCAPSWASSSGGPSCRPRAAPSWWPTTTRWSCAASPTSREDPGLIDALTSGSDVHRMVAAAVYGIPPEEVTHTQREFSQDGLLRPGLRHGGLRPEPAPRRRRRGGGRHHGELLRRLPAREAVHGPHGGRRQDPRRHPHHVRPHPARCPTCSRRTTGCARRPSARP